MIPIIVIVFLIVALFIWWRFLYVPRPKYPPLEIDSDDPLMVEAHEKARETIAEFQELYHQPHTAANVKVPFVTSSDVREYLWAEVLSISNDEVHVRYTTPPVTHNGQLERLHTHPISDIADWQVEFLSGKYAGGYSMRVMFVRGREQWGFLPPELEALEQKYV